MPEDRLDKIIREALTPFCRVQEKKTPLCLSDEDVASYAAAITNNSEIEARVSRHIAACGLCFSKASQAISTIKNFKDMEFDMDIETAAEKARSIPRLYPRGKDSYLKKNRCLFVAALFFALSFIVKRYFLQFLAAALVFGFKWVMDTGGSKALIMIYDAWQGRNKRQEDQETPSRFTKNTRH